MVKEPLDTNCSHALTQNNAPRVRIPSHVSTFTVTPYIHCHSFSFHSAESRFSRGLVSQSRSRVPSHGPCFTGLKPFPARVLLKIMAKDGLLAPRDVYVCTIYMFLATAMWVVNKKTMKHLPIPFFVMLVQTLATVLLLKLCQRMGVIQMKPYSWQVFGTWVNTGFVWAIPLALNLRALTRLNPETLIVFRTATLIGVTFGDHLYGKKFIKREVLSIGSILTGCSVYAWYDAQYDAEGYMWAGLYWAAMVVSMLVRFLFSFLLTVSSAAPPCLPVPQSHPQYLLTSNSNRRPPHFHVYS